jgi:hypothetical protein
VLELITQIFEVLTQTSGEVTNKDIIKFQFIEKLKTNKDEKGRPLYDDLLNERVNSIPQSSSQFS